MLDKLMRKIERVSVNIRFYRPRDILLEITTPIEMLWLWVKANVSLRKR
jgi:hypothetical protein